MRRFVPRPHLQQVSATPHGGSHQLRTAGFDPSLLADFSASLLPVAPPPAVRAALQSVPLRPYPDPTVSRLRAALAPLHSAQPDEVLCGNGSVALIHALCRLCVGPGEVGLVVGPTFGEYAAGLRLVGARVVEVCTTDPEAVLAAVADANPKLLFVCQPNNPTGHRWSEAALDAFAARAPLVVDMAYVGLLAPDAPAVDRRVRPDRLSLWSLTKDHALAGVRVGYATGPAELVKALAQVCTPWGVSAVAEAVALAALESEAHYQAGRRALWIERARLITAVQALGGVVHAGAAPFFLVEVDNAAAVFQELLAEGVVVRDCTSFGLPQRIRISPQTTELGDRLVAALPTVADRMRPRRPSPLGGGAG